MMIMERGGIGWRLRKPVIARDFRREHQPLVVVDKSEDAVSRAAEQGYLAALGDAGDIVVALGTRQQLNQLQGMGH